MKLNPKNDEKDLTLENLDNTISAASDVIFKFKTEVADAEVEDMVFQQRISNFNEYDQKKLLKTIEQDSVHVKGNLGPILDSLTNSETLDLDDCKSAWWRVNEFIAALSVQRKKVNEK